MSSVLKFGPPPAVSLHKEYGGLELTMEIVENTAEAVNHINKYSSSHTDVIITDNGIISLRKLSYIMVYCCSLSAC